MSFFKKPRTVTVVTPVRRIVIDVMQAPGSETYFRTAINEKFSPRDVGQKERECADRYCQLEGFGDDVIGTFHYKEDGKIVKHQWECPREVIELLEEVPV